MRFERSSDASSRNCEKAAAVTSDGIVALAVTASHPRALSAGTSSQEQHQDHQRGSPGSQKRWPATPNPRAASTRCPQPYGDLDLATRLHSGRVGRPPAVGQWVVARRDWSCRERVPVGKSFRKLPPSPFDGRVSRVSGELGRQRAGRGFEADPAVVIEIDLGPGVRVSSPHDEGARILRVPSPGRKPTETRVGMTEASGHHCERGGVLLAVADRGS